MTDPQPIKISYRWLSPAEVRKVGDIDRSERIHLGYVVEEGELVATQVDWDVPAWSLEGEHSHTIIHQIEFCQGHIDVGGRLLGAFMGERLVGIAVLTPDIRPGLAQLAYLHVSDAFRRQGIARRLTSQVCEQAWLDGADRLYVSATPSGSAVGFYRSQGFELAEQPIPELYELEPEDIHMLKRLL
ncbi:MAG: GNAT family N-acetyltransferase [Chloroflexi bacterium]|nr:GNAT family N-acetyltransferase [Chloroflexota bacterium]